MTGRLVVTLATVLAGGVAAPHPGGAAGGGFATGFLHPIMGWDHVAAMVAVGLWGAFLGRPAIWALPVAFPFVMAVGGAAAVAGTPFPAVELGIAVSGLVIGLMVALALRPPIWAAAAMVGVFALFHGHAHGSEMPGAASPQACAAGFVLGTGLLHLGGVAFGMLAGSATGRIAVRALGGVIAAAGAVFTVGALSCGGWRLLRMRWRRARPWRTTPSATWGRSTRASCIR